MDTTSNNNLSSKVILGLPIATMIVSNIGGHYIPIVSILSTPMTISIVAVLIYRLRVNLIYRLVIISLFIISNDYLIKTFAWGNYDIKGAGVFNFFTIISSIIAIIIVSISQFLTDKTFKITSFLPVIIISLFVIPYMNYAQNYGLEYTLPKHSNRESSKVDDVFMYDLKFSNKKFGIKNDSIEILSGWAEKRLSVDHTSFFIKDTSVSGINYHISLKYSCPLTYPKFNYKINSENINGSKSVRDSVLKISNPSFEPVFITFFYSNWWNKFKNDSIVKKVHLYPDLK